MTSTTDQDLLSIGPFAEATGLTHKALRLYAELGLLAPAHTDPFTRYRYYRPEQVRAAGLIRLMREMEMPLAEIRRVLAADPAEAEAAIADYEHKFVTRLEQVRQTRRQLIQYLHTKDKDMTLKVHDKALEPQQVVTRQGSVHVGELDAYIGQSLDLLHKFVTEQGGASSGPPLGIYHGPISQTDDGPIEICLPASGAFTATGEISIRQLPGGRAAVVEVSGDYCAFPKILEAYDAAYDWIVSHGHEHAEAPREVWLGEGSEGPFQIVWPYA